MRWWVQRGGRWDGEGDLFNLVAALWFVADALASVLILLGVPVLMVSVLWLYSVWVAGNALEGAMPKVSLGYAIGGIVISFVPIMVVMGGVPPGAAGAGGG